MAISIRDPRAAKLAKELAARRNTTMTAAIVQALEAELAREREARPLHERLIAFADKVDAVARPKRRKMSPDEIDAMWTD